MGERGQVLAIVAICLSLLMGFAGMAVDLGFLEYQQRQQQSAADGAAIGGAEALLYGTGCPNQTAASAAAITDAAKNGFTHGSGGVTVVPHNPPLSGPLATNNCAVYVQVNSPHPTFFARLFNLSGNESTEATAMLAGVNDGCIYLLSKTTTSTFSGSHVIAPNCQIYINASGASNMSSSTIDASTISYAGIAPNISGATFAEATPAPGGLVRDPCPNIAGCEYLANNPPSTSGCSAGGTYTNTSLTAGCYDTLTLSGGVTLGSGLYTINGGQFHVSGTVTGSGVTFYMTSGVQDTNFSSATMTISPPTSGNTTGVLFYRNPLQTSALDFSNCVCSFGGLLYFPTSEVNYSSGGGLYTVLVAGSADFSTSSQGTDFGTPPLGQTLVKQVVLAE